MNRVVLKDIPLRPRSFSGGARVARRILFGLFAAEVLLVELRLWVPMPFLGSARWPEGLLVVLAAAVALASLRCRLPGQNVMLAAFIIAIAGGAAHTLNVLTNLPFGPLVYTQRMGPELVGPLPWAMPMLWVIALLTARDVVRLILRPWRQIRAYGFWLLGLNVALVVLFELGLEPFATQVKEYWRWQPTLLPVDWYSAPLVNFLAWAVVALLILAFATPALLNKKPVKSPPDFYPLALWLMLNVLFLTGVLLHQLWGAAAVILAENLVVAVCAIRGGRW